MVPKKKLTGITGGPIMTLAELPFHCTLNEAQPMHSKFCTDWMQEFCTTPFLETNSAKPAE